MVKCTMLLFLILIASKAIFSQQLPNSWKVGLGFGTVQYFGELDNQLGDFKKLNSGLDLILQKQLNPAFDVNIHYGFNYIEAFDKLGHNYSMFGNLHTIQTGASMNIIRKQVLAKPYIKAELGFIFGNTWGSSMDNMGKRYDKSIKALCGSFGAGLNYKLSETISAFTEANILALSSEGIDGATNDPNVGDFFVKYGIGLVHVFGQKSDNDNDGVSNKLDKCPDTPQNVKVDNNGCPLDIDKDETPDYLDKCPYDFGLIALQGCPDRDKDGLSDDLDSCPNEPGPIENKGCPEVSAGEKEVDKPLFEISADASSSLCANDKDCDGLSDKFDKCPDEAGDIRNYGCPLTSTTSKWRRDIKVPPIHFVSGATYITDFSKRRIDQLIDILNKNENLSVWLFGHTDAKGASDINQTISEKRVEIVVKYLIDKGVSPYRIFSMGFGETFPVSFGRTEEDLLLNRRIDFYLFE